MMLEDKMLIDLLSRSLRRKRSMQRAIRMVMKEIREFFDSIDDEYTREALT